MIKTFEEYLTEGAWGYGSLDNDYVLDDRDELLKNFIDATLKNAKKIIKKTAILLGKHWDLLIV